MKSSNTDWFQQQVQDAKARVNAWPEQLRGDRAVAAATLPSSFKGGSQQASKDGSAGGTHGK